MVDPDKVAAEVVTVRQEGDVYTVQVVGFEVDWSRHAGIAEDAAALIRRGVADAVRRAVDDAIAGILGDLGQEPAFELGARAERAAVAEEMRRRAAVLAEQFGGSPTAYGWVARWLRDRGPAAPVGELLARIKELEDALRPWGEGARARRCAAAAPANPALSLHEDATHWWRLRVGDMRRARGALGQAGGG